MKKRQISLTHKNLYDFLRELGLSQNQGAAYISALSLGNALVKDIAKHARMNRTTAYNILLELRKEGLVSSYEKNNLLHFSAIDPDRIRALLDKKIEETERLKTTLKKFLPEFTALFHSQAHGASVKIFEGINSLPEVYLSIVQVGSPQDKNYEFTNWGGKFDLFPKQLREDMFVELRKRGIWTKSLLIEDEMTREWKKNNKGESQRKKIKLLPNPGWDFFVNLEVYNTRVALVTYRNDVDFQAIVIDSKELSSMLSLLFTTVWNQLPDA